MYITSRPEPFGSCGFRLFMCACTCTLHFVPINTVTQAKNPILEECMHTHVHVYVHVQSFHVHVYREHQQHHDPTPHLIILAVNEGQLEAVLCGVDGEGPSLGLPVQTVHRGALHQRDVDGKVQCADDAMVTEQEGKEGRVLSQSHSLCPGTDITSLHLYFHAKQMHLHCT